MSNSAELNIVELWLVLSEILSNYNIATLRLFLMQFKNIVVSENVATDISIVRMLFCKCLHVCFQLLGTSEPHGTEHADIGLPSCD